MPTGIPIKYLHCGKCEGSKFRTISDLRKHQWKAHPEQFANMNDARARAKAWRRRKKKARAVAVAVPPIVYPPEQRNSDMSVKDLLTELKGQQKFINDVVLLITGIMARHQEGA